MTLKKKILVALMLLFVIAQFFSPKKNQSGLYATDQFSVETQAPTEVKKFYHKLVLIVIVTRPPIRGTIL